MDGAELTFAGSGDAFGSGGRFQTCLHLRHPDGCLLLDCGASSLVALRRLGLDPGQVDAVAVSHLHGDHFGGLPFLILDGQFSRRTRPLAVAGPPGIAARVAAAMEAFFPGSTAVARRFPVEYVELAPRTPAVIGPVTVTGFPVVHPSGAPAYALRVAAGGRVVAYSGDTEWTDALLEVAAGADLFVCEAYVWDRRVKYHLDWPTLARHRDRLGCRRLVVTHLGPEMLARRDEVDGEVAEDGLRLRL